MNQNEKSIDNNNNNLRSSKGGFKEFAEIEKTEKESSLPDSKEISVNRSQFNTLKRKQGAEKELDGLEGFLNFEINPFEVGLRNSLFFRVHIAGAIETATVSLV